jgi:CubicO group peptidase (beta-lactamase class C family)
MTTSPEIDHDSPDVEIRFSRRNALAASALGVAAGIGGNAMRATAASAQATPSASTEDWSWLDQTVDEAMKLFGIIGAAVAVVSKSGTLHSITAGVRDQSTQQPVTENTHFFVASTTKSMTSTMVATYVDDGAFDWDQTVREVWPEFYAPNDELTQTMRVRDLMGMDSGIGEPPAASLYQGSQTAPEVVRGMAALPVDHPPQTTFFYNNSVYVVGGYLPFLNDAEGIQLETAYASALYDRVLTPTGMTSARITDDPRPFSDNYAIGYEFDFVESLSPQPWATVGSFAPVGGVMATLNDMASYVSMQLGGGVSVAGDRVVSTENLKECWKQHTNDPIAKEYEPDLESTGYAMGWITQTYRDGRTLSWHNGGLDGFISFIGFFEADDLGLVVLTNNGLSGNGLAFYPYLLNALLSSQFGLNTTANDALVAALNTAIQQRQALADSATAVSKATIDRYLGIYEHGYSLAFDDEGALWLRLGRRSFRIMGLPDGDYVIASGIITGTPVKFSIDANGDTWMEITQFETVRWLQGL